MVSRNELSTSKNKESQRSDGDMDYKNLLLDLEELRTQNDILTRENEMLKNKKIKSNNVQNTREVDLFGENRITNKKD